VTARENSPIGLNVLGLRNPPIVTDCNVFGSILFNVLNDIDNTDDSGDSESISDEEVAPTSSQDEEDSVASEADDPQDSSHPQLSGRITLSTLTLRHPSPSLTLPVPLSAFGISH